MTPDGSRPTPYKPYYDIASWFVTQLAFAFTTSPFILLTIQNTTRVWGAVYFYAVVGTILSSAFLASPGKAWLQKKVKARSTKPESLSRSQSHDSLQGATLGVPSEPGKEFDEAVDEIAEEVKKIMAKDGKQTVEDKKLKGLVADMLHQEKAEGVKIQ